MEFSRQEYWNGHSILQEIFLTQGSNSSLPHCKQIVYCLSHQFSSVAQSCSTLCNSMNRSTPGLPVHHQLPEFIQTHVHRVSDAIQPSHPLLFPSLPAPIPPGRVIRDTQKDLQKIGNNSQ